MSIELNASNKTYDTLNSMVRYILPALGTLYFALSGIWGFPYAEEVIGTIVALEAFLGVLIFLARRGWKTSEGDYDGDLLIDAMEEGNDLLSVALNRPIESVRTKDQINLKVVPADLQGKDLPQ